MKTYTLSQHGIAQIRRRYIRRMGTLFGIVFCFVIGLDLLRSEATPLFTLIISFIFLVGIAIFIVSINLKRTEEIWRSVKVETGEDFVARSQVRVPEVRINYTEITFVEEIGSGLCIHTSDKLRTLAIPIELDDADYQEIRELIVHLDDRCT